MLPRRMPLFAVFACALILLTSLVPAPGRAQAADHVVISEVMYDPPQTGTDTDFEWVELYNPTGNAVELGGWKLQDNTSQDVLPAFVLGAGEYLVVAATRAGFLANFPDFAGSLISLDNALGNGLANGGDRVSLLDGSGAQIDAMSYGSDTTAFSPACPDVPESQSLARVPSDRDSDTKDDWVAQISPNPGAAGSALPTPTATTSATATATVTASATPTLTPTMTAPPTASATPAPFGTTTLTPAPSPTATRTPTVTATGTPTRTPTSLPGPIGPGDVIINEIMQNPAAVLDSAGEWFEVYNATAQAIDLNGWTIADAGSEHHQIANPGGPLWLPAGGYLVLGRNKSPAENGGVNVAYQYASFSLGNSDDEIILRDTTGAEIDRVAYDGGSTFPDPSGASMHLVRPDLDNAVGANWRAAALRWPGSAGDLGSPGAVNHTARIEGYVYEDRNANRTRDAGEPGIAGVVIDLDDGRTARTLASGWYALFDLAPGAYGVSEHQPAGYASTTPDRLTVAVALGQISAGHNFGELPVAPSPTPTGGAVSFGPLLLSEVLYDAPQSGTDSAWEWAEIFNPHSFSVDLAGWRIGDNGGEDAIPAFVLEPGGYLVVAATAAGFMENQPGFTGYLVALEGTLGNGLSNSGDVVRLIAPDGAVVDAMSYGENTAAFAPACPDAPAGQSLARVPSWQDTDTAADWAIQPAPNPGAAPAPPGVPTATPVAPAETPTSTPTWPAAATATPTPTATASPTRLVLPTPTPTLGPLPDIRLNEILPRPDVVDWDGNGTADAYDEWIELVNFGAAAVDLGGWALDDIPGGSDPYVFPAGTLLGPGEFLVRYRSSTGVALNQDADTARLLSPDGREVDVFAYANPRRDASYSRTIDGAGEWTEDYPPSPGASNRPGEPTPTATPGPSCTPTATRTATPTPTAVVYDPAALRLNEVLPAPSAVDWNGDGTANSDDEWVELINVGGQPIDLAGWALDDIAAGGSTPYVFPAGASLDPGGFLVLYRSQSRVALNNDADTARLLGPDGAEVDTFTYTHPRSDRSYSRAADGDGAWIDAYPPSPGRSNQPATPTPTATPTATATAFPAGVALNELLPDPQHVDWDHNGAANFADEWIELYNGSAFPASLGGWAVADDTKTYTLPLGIVIWPQSYLLLYRAETALSLSDWADQVTLLRPDGSVADTFAYERGPGADRSYCRGVDGSGAWTAECVVTPGESNRLLPPAPPSSGGGGAAATPTPVQPASIAAARAAPPDTRARVTGIVVYPPGLIPRTIYLQDAAGGIKVYLRTGDYPALAVGDRVQVTGWTRDFHGELELSVPAPSYLTRLGPGLAPAPLPITTGGMGETHEGRLVWLMGRVTRFEPQALTLDDGTGPARIYFPADLPWRRPYVQIGEFWAAVGVVGQYAYDGPPWVGGYRLLPRCEADVSLPPAWLPVTGGG